MDASPEDTPDCIPRPFRRLLRHGEFRLRWMVKSPAALKIRWRIARERPLFWASLELLFVTIAILWLCPGPKVNDVPTDTRIRAWALALQSPLPADLQGRNTR
jgi:hypothetical protein